MLNNLNLKNNFVLKTLFTIAFGEFNSLNLTIEYQLKKNNQTAFDEYAR